MPLATARAMVEGWVVVIVEQAFRREMWRCPRDDNEDSRALANLR